MNYKLHEVEVISCIQQHPTIPDEGIASMCGVPICVVAKMRQAVNLKPKTFPNLYRVLCVAENIPIDEDALQAAAEYCENEVPTSEN